MEGRDRGPCCQGEIEKKVPRGGVAAHSARSRLNGRTRCYQASLEPRKIYRMVEDPAVEARRLLRVVDESGEDYLFPAGLFVPIEVPEKAVPAFAITTSSAQ